jgi:hypothetical protein
VKKAGSPPADGPQRCGPCVGAGSTVEFVPTTCVPASELDEALTPAGLGTPAWSAAGRGHRVATERSSPMLVRRRGAVRQVLRPDRCARWPRVTAGHGVDVSAGFAHRHCWRVTVCNGTGR